MKGTVCFHSEIQVASVYVTIYLSRIVPKAPNNKFINTFNGASRCTSLGLKIEFVFSGRPQVHQTFRRERKKPINP